MDCGHFADGHGGFTAEKSHLISENGPLWTSKYTKMCICFAALTRLVCTMMIATNRTYGTSKKALDEKHTR